MIGMKIRLTRESWIRSNIDYLSCLLLVLTIKKVFCEFMLPNKKEDCKGILFVLNKLGIRLGTRILWRYGDESSIFYHILETRADYFTFLAKANSLPKEIHPYLTELEKHCFFVGFLGHIVVEWSFQGGRRNILLLLLWIQMNEWKETRLKSAQRNTMVVRSEKKETPCIYEPCNEPHEKPRVRTLLFPFASIWKRLLLMLTIYLIKVLLS